MTVLSAERPYKLNSTLQMTQPNINFKLRVKFGKYLMPNQNHNSQSLACPPSSVQCVS